MSSYRSTLGESMKTHDSHFVSKNGPGWSWVTETVQQQPWLFGSGGHEDGVTALIKTNNNITKEEELTMHNMGNRMIDAPLLHRNIANSNKDFNWSQFKTGRELEGTQTDPAGDTRDPNNVMMPFTTVSGVSEGDVAIEVDPRGDMMEMVAAAIGSVSQMAWSQKGDEMLDNVSGKGVKSTRKQAINPFSSKTAKSAMSGLDTESYEEPIPLMPSESEDPQESYLKQDGDTLGYFRKDKLSNEEQQVYNKMLKTGLRRVNIVQNHNNPQRDAGFRTEHMFETVNQMTEEQNRFRNGLTTDERDATLERARYPGSQYATTQMGLRGLSRARYKQSKASSKGRNGKLGGQQVGV
jgi:hypothetical protein